MSKGSDTLAESVGHWAKNNIVLVVCLIAVVLLGFVTQVMRDGSYIRSWVSPLRVLAVRVADDHEAIMEYSKLIPLDTGARYTPVSEVDTIHPVDASGGKTIDIDEPQSRGTNAPLGFTMFGHPFGTDTVPRFGATPVVDVVLQNRSEGPVLITALEYSARVLQHSGPLICHAGPVEFSAGYHLPLESDSVQAGSMVLTHEIPPNSNDRIALTVGNEGIWGLADFRVRVRLRFNGDKVVVLHPFTIRVPGGCLGRGTSSQPIQPYRLPIEQVNRSGAHGGG